MGPQVEIESIFEYYDAPLSGEARLGDQRLYYTWVDDIPVSHPKYGPRKRRQYCAYILSDEEWAILERERKAAAAAVTPDGGDAGPEFLQAADDAISAVGKLHEALESREGIVSFTSSSIPFPSYFD